MLLEYLIYATTFYLIGCQKTPQLTSNLNITTKSKYNYEKGPILIESRERVVIITLNRPDLNMKMYEQLKNEIQYFDGSNRNTRCIVITGIDKIFCAGIDLKEYVDDPNEIKDFEKKFFNFMKDLSIPIIAYVNGYCVGSGFTLALNCDFIVAKESAQFVYPNINIGKILRNDEIDNFKNIVGMNTSKYLLLTGKSLDASEAKRLNIVQDIVSDNDTLPDYIDHISKFPQQLLEKVKNQFTVDNDFFHPALDDIEKEGIKAILEKRKPDWKRFE